MTTLVQRIASSLRAMDRCNDQWHDVHRNQVEELVTNYMPSGSGIDNGTKIDWERSTPHRLVFSFGYHHMNDAGMYVQWTHHDAIVTPDWDGIDIEISNLDEIVMEKGYDEEIDETYGMSVEDSLGDYLHETFRMALMQEV